MRRQVKPVWCDSQSILTPSSCASSLSSQVWLWKATVASCLFFQTKIGKPTHEHWRTCRYELNFFIPCDYWYNYWYNYEEELQRKANQPLFSMNPFAIVFLLLCGLLWKSISSNRFKKLEAWELWYLSNPFSELWHISIYYWISVIHII